MYIEVSFGKEIFVCSLFAAEASTEVWSDGAPCQDTDLRRKDFVEDVDIWDLCALVTCNQNKLLLYYNHKPHVRKTKLTQLSE